MWKRREILTAILLIFVILLAIRFAKRSPQPDSSSVSLSIASPTPVKTETPVPPSPRWTPSFQIPDQGDSGISGRISDPEGRPLDGAEVFLCERISIPSPGLIGLFLMPLPKAGKRFDTFVTPADGTYRFRKVPTGSYVVTAKAEGFAQNGIDVLNLEGQEVRSEVNLRLYPGDFIQGIVVGEMGRPLSNAKIKPLKIENRIMLGGPQWIDFDPGYTNDRGMFRLNHLSAGDYHLKATARGYAPNEQFNISTGSQDILIVLTEGLILYGRVFDEAGEGIAGAEIQVQETRQGSLSTPRTSTLLFDDPVRTNRYGNFSLEGISPSTPGTQVTLLAMAPGYQCSDWTLPENWPEEATPSDMIQIVLNPGTYLKGQVQDREGNPVSGVEIQAIRIRDRNGASLKNTKWPWKTFYSSRRGQFELYGIPEGQLDLNLIAKKYSPLYVRDIPVPQQQSLVLTLEKGAAILGRVVHKEDSTVGLSGVVVTARQISSEAQPAQIQPLADLTDSTGSFAFEGLTPGQYEIRASQSRIPGRESVTVEVGPDEVLTSVVLTLEFRSSIHGRVLSAIDRLPITGARVTAKMQQGRQETESDANGYFFLESLVPGTWGLSVYAEDYIPITPDSYPDGVVQLSGNGIQKEITLYMTQGGTVKGTILNIEDQPLRGAVVMTSPEPGQNVPQVSTMADKNGRFDLKRVPSDVDFRILVTHRSYVNYQSESMRLSQGEKRQLEPVRLQKGGLLLGRLMNQSGEGISGQITLNDMTFRTRADGSFSLKGLPAGLRTLSAGAEGYAPKEVPVLIQAGKKPDPIEVRLDVLPLD